jgi:hypothetical protein
MECTGAGLGFVLLTAVAICVRWTPNSRGIYDLENLVTKFCKVNPEERFELLTKADTTKLPTEGA